MSYLLNRTSREVVRRTVTGSSHTISAMKFTGLYPGIREIAGHHDRIFPRAAIFANCWPGLFVAVQPGAGEGGHPGLGRSLEGAGHAPSEIPPSGNLHSYPPNPAPLRPRIAHPESSFPEHVQKTSNSGTNFPKSHFPNDLRQTERFASNYKTLTDAFGRRNSGGRGG